jgi:hypothetical protein
MYAHCLTPSSAQSGIIIPYETGKEQKAAFSKVVWKEGHFLFF